MNHAMTVETGYRNLPLSLLDESPTNPRRTFEPSKLVELAQSIRNNGLIQPITVRPRGERFEIVAGARRFRAAQIAELIEVPTRIIELNDEQTLEVQIIENSQREDVHPYEEASGYQRLLSMPGYDVAALASKCSKSPSHVYSRLTLLSLIPEVAESFQQGGITASHANLLARLSPEQQAEAFPNAFRKDYRDDEQNLLPAKYLATWIQENLYLSLGSTPFDKDDASLLPEAGSCPDCPKRTGYNTALFADVKDDSCLDGSCFRSKITAHIDRAKAGIPNLVQISTLWRPAKDKPAGELSPYEYTVITGGEKEPKPTCDNAVPAIVTHGSEVGQVYCVCADQDCPVHHPRRSGPTLAGRSDEEFEARMAEQRKEAERRQAEKARREKRLQALILRFPATGTDDQTRFLLTALVRGDLDDAMERIALRLEDDKTDADKSSDDVCVDAIATCMPSSIYGYLAELALGSWIDEPRPEERDFLAEAEKQFPKTPRATPGQPAKQKPRPAAKKLPQKKAAIKKSTLTRAA